MIGEVNPLAGVWLAIDPADGESTEQLRQQHDRMAGEGHGKESSDRRPARTIRGTVSCCRDRCSRQFDAIRRGSYNCRISVCSSSLEKDTVPKRHPVMSARANLLTQASSREFVTS